MNSRTPVKTSDKSLLLQKALRLEYVTVGWNIVEAFVAVGAGIIAHSIALVGFGLDSVIEVTAAATIIWRLRQQDPDAEPAAEKRALRVVGVTFFLLAIYVAIESGKTLWFKEEPRLSWMGIIITAISAVLMPGLAWLKRRTALELGSRAFAADAAETKICGYLSLIVLAGLALNALWGWWWADPVAGLIMVAFLINEGREAWEGSDCGC